MTSFIVERLTVYRKRHNGCYVDKSWHGYVRLNQEYCYMGYPNTKIKRYLTSRWPSAKISVAVDRVRHEFIDFDIVFAEDADEVEFIMNVGQLEGETL